MFLPLLRCTSILFFLDIEAVLANTLEIRDTAYYPVNISQQEACETAKINAQKQAMSKAGLEKGRFADLEICTDDEAGATCSLIQESQSYYEGGYITSTDIIRQNIENIGYERQCVIHAKIKVERFKGTPDPNFALSAELSKKKLIANETFFLIGETSKKAYIYLLGYLPQTDELYTIIPNRFETVTLSDGEFVLPSKNSRAKYALEALIPKNYEDDQVSEVLLLLATIDEFSLLNKESAPNFYRRLNELGRDRWRKVHLGYTIFRE